MDRRFLNKKTQGFYFINDDGERKSYDLIFGDEVTKIPGTAPSAGVWEIVEYRNRLGEMKEPKLATKRTLEMYFLDVGQGDAAFIVTPNNKKILVDGGLRKRALGFLVWKYRLDEPKESIIIDYLILSHADKDHVEGLIPILNHPQIQVKNILHNGIGVFKSGFNTKLGNVDEKDRLTTLHNKTGDLRHLNLSRGFSHWIQAVKKSVANYQAVDSSSGVLDIEDSDVTLEILGPIRELDGYSLKWFKKKKYTINGHSVIFRLTYKDVGTLFSGDLNSHGSKHLLAHADVAKKLEAHIFKSPHHGSHEYYQALFNAINPMITIVSSGDSPDYGHPRAQFLGAIGIAGRSQKPLIFSTEIAATFKDTGDSKAVAEEIVAEKTTFDDLNFATSRDNYTARLRFKKVLPGIINVRTDGEKIYAARRIKDGWESYKITPLDKTNK